MLCILSFYCFVLNVLLYQGIIDIYNSLIVRMLCYGVVLTTMYNFNYNTKYMVAIVTTISIYLLPRLHNHLYVAAPRWHNIQLLVSYFLHKPVITLSKLWTKEKKEQTYFSYFSQIFIYNTIMTVDTIAMIWLSMLFTVNH